MVIKSYLEMKCIGFVKFVAYRVKIGCKQRPLQFMSVYLKSETGDKVELCMKSSKQVAKDYGELRPYARTLGKKLCIGSNTEVHTGLK